MYAATAVSAMQYQTNHLDQTGHQDHNSSNMIHSANATLENTANQGGYNENASTDKQQIANYSGYDSYGYYGVQSDTGKAAQYAPQSDYYHSQNPHDDLNKSGYPQIGYYNQRSPPVGSTAVTAPYNGSQSFPATASSLSSCRYEHYPPPAGTSYAGNPGPNHSGTHSGPTTGGTQETPPMLPPSGAAVYYENRITARAACWWVG